MAQVTPLQLALLKASLTGYAPHGATEHSQMRTLERRLLVAELPANERPNPWGRYYRATARGKAVVREAANPVGLGSTIERVA